MSVMDRVRYYVTSKWAERLLSQWVTSIMMMGHAALGLVVLLASDRLTGSTYEPMIEMVDGHMWVWAVWIIASAILMGVPFRWPIIAGIWLGMFWMFMWAGLFTFSVVRHDDADAMLMVAFSIFALIDVALLTARVTGKNEG